MFQTAYKKIISHTFLYLQLCVLLFASVSCGEEKSQESNTSTIRGLNNTVSGAGSNSTLRAVLVLVDARPDDPISQSIRADMMNITKWLDILEKRNIIKVERTLIQGEKATLATIQQSLQNMQSNKDDVLLFYFSGHGGMEQGETFINTHDDKFFFRKDLTKILTEKQGRLRIAITDACSNAIDGYSVSRSLSRAAKAANGDFDEIYKTLFYNYEGMLDIAASSKGEYAWSTDDLGGFFTHYFIKEGMLKNPSANWNDVFEKAKDRTVQMFNRMSDADKRELAKEGIMSQTPVAYYMPTLLSENNSSNNENKNQNNENNNQDNTNNNQNTTQEGEIKLVNNTTKNITFFIDNNTENAEWSDDKLIKQQVTPQATAQIAQSKATITFKSGGRDLYYDLEKGNYYFEFDEHKAIDLFGEADKTDKSYALNYDQLLNNTEWAWEDSDGTRATTSFTGKNFKDNYENGNAADGTWNIVQENLKGTNTTLINFVTQTEEGKYTMTYAMNVEDGGSAIQLVFVRANENGNKISYRQMLQDNEGFNPVIVLYRK